MDNNAVMENPFTPTFGEIPAHMAGRQTLIDDLRRAFSASRRQPHLTTIITGARGSGKTALLSLAAEEAQGQGWVAARTIAMPGMLDDILISARRASAHLVPASSGQSRISGFEVGGMIGLDWQREKPLTNWRNDVSDLLDQLAESDTGLLITVDEVQPSLDEMIRLAAIYQLFVTEGRKVALLMAGLPHNMLALEKDKTVSFLRRAQKCQLGRIPDFEVTDAMKRTIEEAGRSIDPEALDEAVKAAGGFPFLMQLIGYRTWDRHPEVEEITLKDAREGIELARAEMRERIVKTTYDSLSNGDRAFLSALAECGDGSSVADVAKRMGKTHSYATQYKNRLLGHGIIEESGRVLRFQMPMMREYVLEQI